MTPILVLLERPFKLSFGKISFYSMVKTIPSISTFLHLRVACCAKPPLEAACFRLHKHKKADVLPVPNRPVIVIKQVVRPLQSPAWGARGRVFESLRPDHIIQGVARFYLATLFYFCCFYPHKTAGSGWNLRSRVVSGKAVQGGR